MCENLQNSPGRVSLRNIFTKELAKEVLNSTVKNIIYIKSYVKLMRPGSSGFK